MPEPISQFAVDAARRTTLLFKQLYGLGRVEPDFEARVATLIAMHTSPIERQRDRLLAACRAIEFLPPAEGNILSYCPDCGYPHDVGHAESCDFGNAIAAAEPEDKQ